jgi:thiol:disulfide interchange protein DsbD
MSQLMPLFRFLILSVFSFLFVHPNAFAQDTAVVKWEAKAKKISGNSYEVRAKGQIAAGWHIYAADSAEGLSGIMASCEGPLQGKIKQQELALFVEKEDPVFDGKKMRVASGDVEVILQLNFSENVPPVLKMRFNYEVANNTSFIPEEQKINITLDETALKEASIRIRVPSIDINNPVSGTGTATETRSKGLLAIFGIGFLGGLVALLLPCFFPMIPLTVSFFTKKATSKSAGIRNAFLYGFFIFAIYVLITIPFHFAEQAKPEIFNNISTNVYLNVFFFLVFVFFAGAFFGYYEITLPSGLTGKADSKAGVGNIAGIFFMALTLVLVSFSCTGPVLGSLLAGTLAGDGGAMRLSFGMAGFGLALALPFALFALFPNWLNSLPKSGGWLNTVKVVLGFLELAFAFKFLSNADLVMHWNLLKREIFIGIWIVIGFFLTLYLFGKIKFPHDSPIKKLAKGRVLLAVLSGLFTLYLVPGVTNTKWSNLKLISGFPPPLYYSIYPQSSDCILGLNCTRDYEEGLKRAKAEYKPLLLDFTGYACVNCRRMEENVWSDAEVNRFMAENFIVVSLYVDDKKKLPLAEQVTYITKEGAERDLQTIGDKWATFETENFANNAQPLYAILDTSEKLLSHPVAYTPDVSAYLQWLKTGLDTFRKK